MNEPNAITGWPGFRRFSASRLEGMGLTLAIVFEAPCAIDRFAQGKVLRQELHLHEESERLHAMLRGDELRMRVAWESAVLEMWSMFLAHVPRSAKALLTGPDAEWLHSRPAPLWHEQPAPMALAKAIDLEVGL